MKTRCWWCGDDTLYRSYHDKEWGVPLRDSERLFEFLMLEGMQAGLSWITILRKREHLRKVFANFNPEKVARFNENKVERLMNDAGIIRSRRKIMAVINNARIYLHLLEQGDNFSEYLWRFTDGKVIQNSWRLMEQVPASTPLSKQMAKTLKQAGFSFVGETICYAFMQAVGMVNDHLADCYRHAELTPKH